MFNNGAKPQKDASRVLVISPSRRIVADLMPMFSQHLPSAKVVEVNGFPDNRHLVDILSKGPIDLCFLDVNSDNERAMHVISDLIGLSPSMQIVALLAANDPDQILQCLRQGGADFLVHPCLPEEFVACLDRIEKLSPAYSGGTNRGKVYCVIPAKGACGASTVACNLAHQCKRLSSGRVLLADLDPLAGTISFLLKVKSTFSFLEAIAHSASLDNDIWKGLVTANQGIDVLLPPDSPTAAAQEVTDAAPIVDFARRAYRYIVVDTSSAYGEWSLSIARKSDEILLVTTNELPSLQAAQRVLAYLENHQIQREKIKLVVNRFNRDVGLSPEMIETALRMEVYQIVPSDYESLQRSLLDGKPVQSATSFGKCLVSLAEKLTGKDTAPTTKPVRSGLSGLFGLFGKRSF
jgi:pilus assembly protein CpaE